jgi:hypothetical protein
VQILFATASIPFVMVSILFAIASIPFATVLPRFAIRSLPYAERRDPRTRRARTPPDAASPTPLSPERARAAVGTLTTASFEPPHEGMRSAERLV